MQTDITKNLPSPENVLKKKFPNGVTVLIRENAWSSTAAVCGSVNAGFCLDPAEKFGLSQFVSACLTAGTRHRGLTQIDEYLESIGGRLAFKSTPHNIRFSGKCLCEDLADYLRLLKELLDEPVFPEECLDILWERMVKGYGVPEEKEKPWIYQRFDEMLWGEDHPYGRRDFTNDDLERVITREDLLDFHSRYFGPRKFVISLVGGFHGEEVMRLCEEIFGAWEKAQEVPDEDALFPDVEPYDECYLTHSEATYRKDVSFLVGDHGPAADDPDIMSAKIGNLILGGSGWSGRLVNTVRYEHGLAYSIYSALRPMKKGGSWSVCADVYPEDLDKAARLVHDELRRFTTEPVSLQELEDAKSWYINSLPAEFVNNTEMAAELHSLAFLERDLDYYLRLPDQIKAVTPETILASAKKWINPNKLVLITTGPRAGTAVSFP